MEELGIDEVIIFNFLVLLEDGYQRYIYLDDLEGHKVDLFRGSC